MTEQNPHIETAIAALTTAWTRLGADIEELQGRRQATARALEELHKITGSTAPAPVVPVAGEQLPPAASPAPSPGQKRTAAARTAPRRKSTHAEVATVARQALADGTSMARAVATHFDINEAAAQKRIQAARKAGHHIEAAKPGRISVDVEADHTPAVTALAAVRAEQSAPKASAAYVLMCDSCDSEVDAEHVSDLTRHCLGEHGRRPSPQERTPVPARGGAA